MPIRIDPNTGERIPDGPQIDPVTGERIEEASPASAHPYLDAAKDFGKGILKSGISTMSAADDFAQKHLPAFMTTPIGQAPTAENSARAVAAAKDMGTANNTAQSIGKGLGNAAQFLIPGAAEEAGASMLAPTLGKVGAKLATSSLGSGVVNATQGGSFSGGAAAGAAGAGLGMGLKALAPKLAETALGVRATDRAYNRTPGQAILSETTGISPGVIANQAIDKVSKYTGDLENNAVNSTIPTDLKPGRDVASSLLQTAIKRNNPATIKEVGQLGTLLDARPSTGAIPRFVPADEALALRRGIDDLHGSWSPNATRDFTDRAVGATRTALNDELEQSVPDFRDLNSKISTLMPVAKRAGDADLNAGIIQRMAARLKTHTGALAAPIAGASTGAALHGPMGGVIGGLGALIGQEVVASPTVQMGVARAADSPLLGKIAIPAAQGIGLQLGRKIQ